MAKVTKQGKRKRKKKSVIDRITSMEDDSAIKMLLYGESGTGKTRTWATFPKPILAIICSGGKRSGELKSVNTKENRKLIKPVYLEHSEEVKELADYQAEEGKFATIVLDHATSLQDLVLKEVAGLDDTPVQASWGIATQQDWGQVALQMKERFRSLLDLTCNVVIVAQERAFNFDSDNEIIQPSVGAALSPSTVGWLNPACDYVCQTLIRQKTIDKKITIGTGKKKQTKVKTVQTGGIDYCLRLVPNEVYTAKFRTANYKKELPEFIVDPSYSKVQELINGD